MPPNYANWHWQKHTVLWNSLGVIFGAIWCCLGPIWSHHIKIDLWHYGDFSWPPVGLLVFCKGLNPSEFDGAIIDNRERRHGTGFWPPIGPWVFSRQNIPQLSAVVLKWPFLGLLKDFLGSVKAKTHQNLMDQFMVKLLVCLGHDLGPLLALRCVLHSTTF